MDARIIAAVAALIVVQLALQVTALVQLVKTPPERVSIGGRKWAWALIIVLGEMIGPILWFAIGRVPAQAAEPTALVPGQEARRSAADALYGDHPDRP